MKKILLLSLASSILFLSFMACTSMKNTDRANRELSAKTAKELINREIEKTKNDVGGYKKNIKEFTVQNIEDNNGVFTIHYIWSGIIEQPSTPPLPGEEVKPDIKVKDEKAEMKVQWKNGKWEIVPDGNLS